MDGRMRAARGRRSLAPQAESADAGALRAALERAARELGRCDIPVNGAGIGIGPPLRDAALQAPERIPAIRVRGVRVAALAAVRHGGWAA